MGVRNSVSDQLRSALAHHQCGDSIAAESGYRSVLDFDPDNADANHLLAMLLHERGNGRLAVEHIQAAIDAEPHSAILQNARCVILIGMNDHWNAVKAAQKAIELDPNLVESRQNLIRARRAYAESSEATGPHGYRALWAI